MYFTACTRTKDILVIDKEGWYNIRKLIGNKPSTSELKNS